MASNTGLASANVSAGDDATATQYNNLVTDVKKLRQESMTAGATINGSTLPVPVYQNTTDNEVYACDANVLTALEFIGFAITNSTNGNAIIVQHTGIVGGFSALDEGELYYVQDAIGTIGKTKGAVGILVGRAISTTQILIIKDSTDDEWGKKQLNAGATIAGATLPIPVYQSTADNEVYACDANDTSKLNFIGFATTDSTDGNAIEVQFNGIVRGFSGLDEGEKYYVQDAVGTIGKTPGTINVLVGIAISATELLIQRVGSIMVTEEDVTTRTLSTSNLNATKTVNTGFKPKYFEAIVILDICDGRNWSEGDSAHSGMKSVHIKGMIDGKSVYFYVNREASILPNSIPSYNPYGSLVGGTFTPPTHANGTTASIGIVCTTSYSFYTITLSTITATANSLVFTFVSAQSGNNCALRYGIKDVTVFE